MKKWSFCLLAIILALAMPVVTALGEDVASTASKAAQT